MRDAQMIQYASDNRIRQFFDCSGASIKGRIGRKDGCAREQQEFEIPDVDKIQRGFARDQNQLLPFLQYDIGGAQQDIFTVAVRDSAKGAHAARNDDHGVRRVGAAGERRVHAFEIVHGDAGGQAQAARQLLSNDRLRIIAQDDMELVLAGIKVVEQALRIQQPAGAGNGNDDSQGESFGS